VVLDEPLSGVHQGQAQYPRHDRRFFEEDGRSAPQRAWANSATLGWTATLFPPGHDPLPGQPGRAKTPSNHINEKLRHAKLMELHTLGVDGGLQPKGTCRELAPRSSPALASNLGTARPNVSQGSVEPITRFAACFRNSIPNPPRTTAARLLLGQPLRDPRPGRGGARRSTGSAAIRPRGRAFVSRKLRAGFFVGGRAFAGNLIAPAWAAGLRQPRRPISPPVLRTPVRLARIRRLARQENSRSPKHYVVFRCGALAYDEKPILNGGGRC